MEGLHPGRHAGRPGGRGLRLLQGQHLALDDLDRPVDRRADHGVAGRRRDPDRAARGGRDLHLAARRGGAPHRVLARRHGTHDPGDRAPVPAGPGGRLEGPGRPLAGGPLVTAALQVEGLHKAFGGVQAVADVSFAVEAGELLALIGPNGAGKSTCFNMLNGQLAPDAGIVRLDGRDIVGLRPRAIWRLGVGRTFQITATFASLSVRENVQMALYSHAGRLGSLLARFGAAFRPEAESLLDQVGMLDQAERPCGVLAYGDLKRVELAMALANQPRLLLMDEPTAGMAPKERVALMALAARLARAQKIAVLFTEHDMDVVFSQADRIIVLDRGQLIAGGRPADVRANPDVRAVYLGSGH
ncbi:MAG: ABC transporter ATP-binding protein [Alphaproteobacteria bacterium]|nr:ABC transporter ATP-binding protein [Alphaproteobacteria bacterium]